jgi:2-C-methyl-D-erythritol 2,4-cyclodiphosphate synthase
MLGAAGLRDIGYYFSNKDKKWKDISSLVLLEECSKLIRKHKLKVGNLDITLILEEPKISPYIDKMKKNIAKTLKIKVSQISIKSTTSEGLGFIGKKQGCSAYSICLLK